MRNRPRMMRPWTSTRPREQQAVLMGEENGHRCRWNTLVSLVDPVRGGWPCWPRQKEKERPGIGRTMARPRRDWGGAGEWRAQHSPKGASWSAGTGRRWGGGDLVDLANARPANITQHHRMVMEQQWRNGAAAAAAVSRNGQEGRVVGHFFGLARKAINFYYKMDAAAALSEFAATAAALNHLRSSMATGMGSATNPTLLINRSDQSNNGTGTLTEFNNNQFADLFPAVFNDPLAAIKSLMLAAPPPPFPPNSNNNTNFHHSHQLGMDPHFLLATTALGQKFGDFLNNHRQQQQTTTIEQAKVPTTMNPAVAATTPTPTLASLLAAAATAHQQQFEDGSPKEGLTSALQKSPPSADESPPAKRCRYALEEDEEEEDGTVVATKLDGTATAAKFSPKGSPSSATAASRRLSTFSCTSSSSSCTNGTSIASSNVVRIVPRTPQQRKPAAPIPPEKKDDAYYERRRKNNDAAKRSRDQRRMKEETTAQRAMYLEQENVQLHSQIAMLRAEIGKYQALMLGNSSPTALMAALCQQQQSAVGMPATPLKNNSNDDAASSSSSAYSSSDQHTLASPTSTTNINEGPITTSTSSTL